MRNSWEDNAAVSSLARVADALSSLADVIPSRRGTDGESESPPSERAPATLPLQDLPAHLKFARIWDERRGEFLRRVQSRPCPSCGATEATVWFATQDGYRYDICAGCGMVYIPEVVPLSVWDQYFADLPDARAFLRAQMEGTITAAALDGHRARFGRYFSLIRDAGAPLPRMRLLDIGTYTGGSLLIAAELGMHAQGVEGLQEAVQFSHERRPELRITHGHAEDLSPAAFDGPFDVVTMWETLEHTFDPRRALRAARCLLAPGGVLGLTVPNAWNPQCSVLRDFCFFAYGGYQGIGHVNLFSPATLRRTLESSGFELIHLETEFGTDWRQIAYYLQHRFDRIHCYRNLVRKGDFADSPEPGLSVVLNWISPALTRIENALLAGPITVALARRTP